jgi:hypothetical protein
MSNPAPDRFTFRAEWSTEDQAYVGTCDQYPSLSHLEERSAQAAYAGILKLVAEVILMEDLA